MGRAQLHLFSCKLKEADAETATNFDVASHEESYVRANMPDDAQAAYLHVRMLQHDGNSEAARSALTSVASAITALSAECVRNHAPTLLLSGYISIALQKYEEAFKRFETFVTRFPAHLGARQVLARLRTRRNELRKAYEILEPVLARSGDDRKLRALRATLLIGLGRQKEAFSALQELYKQRS